ncbi:T9SS type A sorting domain-containing protein [Chryseobacterium formosus]|uniref:T9SS type A sorting domain-containing protein n=1 Tax=Chryseobacterium formosus TaxID=1537363 RepID=A0ABT3XXA8_9FLAO|nr:T9SS type A sorting domain-containing protein [Chryseobacterium formosus]MCX8526289.1 T9SS type A sorting domain-containing protein [Chryseobacterium formosus]
MKKTLLILISATGIWSAQTITKAFNDPIIGETVNNVNVNGTVNNSATGNNATFTNTSLTAGTATSTVYSAPTASEISTFPGSTIKMTGDGNTALYKQTATKLEITGLVTPDATLNFSANNGTIITYPASFGYNETDQAQGIFTSTTASGLFKGTIVNTADAAGTLLIGNKTYTNVLRIKSVQNFNLYQSTDTFFVFSIGTVTNTSYSYYSGTNKFAILTSTSGNISVPLLSINQSTSGATALNEAFLAVSDLKLKEKLSIYPNPAQDFVQVKGEISSNSKVNIYGLDGKLIKTTDLKSGKVEISELPPSAYFIEVSDSNKSKETAKFIKK